MNLSVSVCMSQDSLGGNCQNPMPNCFIQKRKLIGSWNLECRSRCSQDEDRNPMPSLLCHPLPLVWVHSHGGSYGGNVATSSANCIFSQLHSLHWESLFSMSFIIIPVWFWWGYHGSSVTSEPVPVSGVGIHAQHPHIPVHHLAWMNWKDRGRISCYQKRWSRTLDIRKPFP